jgi:hypothetical protein
MGREWRCTRCGRLLGVLEGERLHLRFARVHDYLVSFPATSVCPKCRALNEVSASKRRELVRVTETEAQG